MNSNQIGKFLELFMILLWEEKVLSGIMHSLVIILLNMRNLILKKLIYFLSVIHKISGRDLVLLWMIEIKWIHKICYTSKNHLMEIIYLLNKNIVIKLRKIRVIKMISWILYVVKHFLSSHHISLKLWCGLQLFLYKYICLIFIIKPSNKPNDLMNF